MHSLAETFKETAAAAHAAFPGRLRGLLVVAVTSPLPVYVSRDIASYLSTKVAAVKEAVKQAADDLRRRNIGGFASRVRSVAGLPVCMVAVDDVPSGVFTEAYTPGMRAIYLLDHEIGHHVVKSGMAGGHRGEAAADAFAALRHIQRYGAIGGFIDLVNKALPLVSGLSPVHYTSAVIERAEEMSQTRDIASLDLTATARLAEEIAADCALTDARLAKLASVFGQAAVKYLEAFGGKRALKDRLFGQDPDAFTLIARETQRIAQGNKDPDVEAAITRFFAFPPMREFMTKEMQKAGDRRATASAAQPV